MFQFVESLKSHIKYMWEMWQNILALKWFKKTQTMHTRKYECENSLNMIRVKFVVNLYVIQNMMVG